MNTKAKRKSFSEADRYTVASVLEVRNKRSAIIKSPIPENETARLACLQKSQALSREPDELFDDLVDLAAHICIAPYAMLSLVESDYVWHKSVVGFPSFESQPREGSFESWTIANHDLFVIEDARRDVRFYNHPLVTDHPRIRFYAAAPLIASDGHAIGTLSVMDWRPRPLKPLQEKALRTLAQDVVLQIELRRKNKELEMTIAEREHLSNQILAHHSQPAQEPETIPAAPLPEPAVSLDDCSIDGLWEWQLTTNQVIYSKKWKALLGYEENEINSSPNEWFNRIHPEDVEKVHAAILDHLHGLSLCFTSQHRLLGSDGVYRWVQSRGQAVLGDDGLPCSIFGSLTTSESSPPPEESFKHSAYHDGLTGLPNRMMFLKRLKRRLERWHRGNGGPFALLLLDIDRFKVINDTYGQPVGDQLLQEFARTLEAATGSAGLVARLEGDRFALMVDNINDVNEAIIAADHLKKSFVEHYEIAGNEIFITAGIGITHSHDQHTNHEDLLRNAEAALGRAKDQGRNGCEAFDLDMLGRMSALSRVETGLHKAIQRQELEVYYQPIVSLQDYQVTGFEALLRWRHPEQGLILPNDFIPIAEETGQIVQVDNWVLSEAAKQVRRWQSDFPSLPPLTVSVNISGRSFLQKDLIHHINAILADTGVRPESLKLEITESAVVEHADCATSTLMKIKDLGLQVILDDFGKGYSSFNYLQQFPVDALKIDHSFISTMNTEKSLQIVRGMMVLAHSLGLKVVAEGVETSEQIIQLIDMDCKLVQGFLFSRPVPARAATDLLTNAYQLTAASPKLLRDCFR